jgi:hypothetical protein
VRKVDETGICAVDCDCAWCSTGHRPSMLARHVARVAADRMRAAREQLPPPAPIVRVGSPRKYPRPLTPEECEEMRRDMEQFRRGTSCKKR